MFILQSLTLYYLSHEEILIRIHPFYLTIDLFCCWYVCVSVFSFFFFCLNPDFKHCRPDHTAPAESVHYDNTPVHLNAIFHGSMNNIFEMKIYKKKFLFMV